MDKTRQRALELKDDLVNAFQQKGVKFYLPDPETNVLMDYLMNKISETGTSEEEILDEVFIIFRTVDRDGEPATVDLVTCSKEAFVIQLIRDCMMNEHIQLTLSNKWHKFAGPYTKYLLAVQEE